MIHESIATQLNKILAKINTVNLEGNLEGLFCNFILRNTPMLQIKWQTNCLNDKWVRTFEKDILAGNYNRLASMGYSTYLFNVQNMEYENLFQQGINTLSEREPYPSDNVSFTMQPLAFLGIAIGVSKLKLNQLKWLQVIFKRRKDKTFSGIEQKLLYSLVESYVHERQVFVSKSEHSNPLALCILLWGVRQGIYRNHIEELPIIENVLRYVIETDLNDLEPWKCSFLVNAVKNIISSSVNSIMMSSSGVSNILRNFEPALRRWRWKINDERDVQAVLWLILRSYFIDVVDENPHQKFGHGYSIVDFGIPSLSLLIEAKIIKKSNEFDDIEDQIKIDLVDYFKTLPQYKKLIVFIYDKSGSVQDHSITEQALKKIEQVEDVVIVSEPSNLKDISST